MNEKDDLLPRRPSPSKPPKPIPLDDDDPAEDAGEDAPPPRAAAPQPAKPLPRMWKTEPEPEAETPATRGKAAGGEKAKAASKPEPSRAASRSKPAPSRRAADPDAPRKGVLIEETPELDTYEARQRIRTILGVVVGLAVVGAIFVFVVPLFRGGGVSDENIPDEGVLQANAGPNPAGPDSVEVEAKNMFENARQMAKNGKAIDAVALLKRLVASYPKTKTAEQAKEAIARPNQTPPLPLFLEESKATIVASNAAKATPPPSEPNDPTVTAIDSAAGKPGLPANGTALVERPANPEDPNASVARANGAATAPGGVVAQALPPGFRPQSESGLHASGWPLLIVSDRDGAPMCFVPGGTFKMGRDDGGPEEAPLHLVNLNAYYIDQHEVTVRMFNLFLKETGQKTLSTTSLKKEGASSEFTVDHPVVGVTIREAVAYLEWAGKRLPTEAQWEKAARSGDGRAFPWGSSAPTWIRPRQSKQIDRVMSYELDQSPFGVYDMAGNAWEWTADYFDPRYYQQFRGVTADNPLGPPARGKAPTVTIKGGSKTWQASWREGLKPEVKYGFLGFRGVLPVGNDRAVTASPAPTAIPSSASPTSRPQPAAPAANANGVVPF